MGFGHASVFWKELEDIVVPMKMDPGDSCQLSESPLPTRSSHVRKTSSRFCDYSWTFHPCVPAELKIRLQRQNSARIVVPWIHPGCGSMVWSVKLLFSVVHGQPARDSGDRWLCRYLFQGSRRDIWQLNLWACTHHPQHLWKMRHLILMATLEFS